MSYKDKPQIKLYKYENSAFVMQAMIDDFQEVSFEHNLYQAGTFTITINYNIPNALKFERGLFVQFGDNPYDFGEIITIQDSIGADGKGSQVRTITGYDARYILKRRVIKNMNSNGLWAMTDKGEVVLRSLVYDQCGLGAEEKRRLSISNAIPQSSSALGKEYSVSENFSNLYEVCKTIATQSEIGWRMAFNGTTLTLEVFEGTDRSQTVRFDTNYESLANGEFSDSSDSFSNAIYIGGKGQNDDRDIYEGEDGTPTGLDRFESWDNQSSMTTESEYEAEAISMLTQYGQTLTMSGNGLAKCPYIFREQYNIGDLVTVAFSGKSATAQILSITEHWSWGAYDIQFSFGKPQNNLSDQLQLMLRKIQEASNKTNSTDSVRWYTIPTDTSMPKADVTYNTIGFVGTCASGGSTFTLYLDNEKTGAKTYHVYFKQLGGGNLTLTTGKAGASDLVLNSGTYVAIIYVDELGNVTSQGATATNSIAVGNTQPATSGGVAQAIEQNVTTMRIGQITRGWWKLGEISTRDFGFCMKILLSTYYMSYPPQSTELTINYTYQDFTVLANSANAYGSDQINQVCLGWNSNNTDKIGVYIYYNRGSASNVYITVITSLAISERRRFVKDIKAEIPANVWANTKAVSFDTLNFNFNGNQIVDYSKIFYKETKIGSFTLNAGETVSPDITQYTHTPPTGCTRLCTLYSQGQNYFQLSTNFVGSGQTTSVYATITNHYSGTLTTDIYLFELFIPNNELPTS